MNLYFIFKQIIPTKILINEIDGLLFFCLQWRGISSKFQTSHFCWINYYRGNWEEFIWVRQMGIIQIYNSKPPMIFKWRKKVSNFPLLLDQLSEGFIWVRQRGIIQIYNLRPSMIFRIPTFHDQISGLCCQLQRNGGNGFHPVPWGITIGYPRDIHCIWSSSMVDI